MFSRSIIDDSSSIIYNSKSVIDDYKWRSKLWHHSLITVEALFTIIIFLKYRPLVKAFKAEPAWVQIWYRINHYWLLHWIDFLWCKNHMLCWALDWKMNWMEKVLLKMFWESYICVFRAYTTVLPVAVNYSFSHFHLSPKFAARVGAYLSGASSPFSIPC